MSIELKIKAKHLALEPNIIRVEEKKLKKQIRYNKNKGGDTAELIKTLESLSLHRRWNVRNEARATYLARAYLTGKAYKSVEIKCNDYNFLQIFILPRIHAMVVKYGDRNTTKQQIWDWICV